MFTVQDASTVITLTDAASDKVKSLIEAEGNPELVLRVAVRPGGCSGLSYEMFFDTDVAADDIKSEHGGVTGGRRPGQRAAPRRRLARLQGRPPGRRVRDQQPERAAHLRLRPELQLATRAPALTACHLLLPDERVEERLHLVAAERAVDARLDGAGAVDAEQPRLALDVPGVEGRHERGCRSVPGRSRCARARSGRRSP